MAAMLLLGSTFPHAVVAGAHDKAKVQPTNQWWARVLALLVEALSAPPEWYKWVCCIGGVVGAEGDHRPASTYPVSCAMLVRVSRPLL